MTDSTIKWSLANLIERGGVYDNVPGTGPKELLTNAIELLPPILGLDPYNLLEEIVAREALMSTGIGRGIALPHPRNPMIENEDPLIAVLYPVQPLDWNTPDGSKVHTLFLMVSSSAKQHLNALSKINFLCQQEKFTSLIKARSSIQTIVAAIREAEAHWSRGE